MNQQGRQFNRNDDMPTRSVRDPDEFPVTGYTDCYRYESKIYEEDGSVFRDENEEDVFELVVPFRDINERLDENDDENGMSDGSDGEDEYVEYNREPADYAYWPQRLLRDAIYGSVWQGEILKRLESPDDRPRWARTLTKVAIKKLDYDQVIRETNSSAEKPEEEIKAMQYLQQKIMAGVDEIPEDHGGVARAEQGLREHGVMTSIDTLTDNEYLYVMMPFCDGLELFDVVQDGKFEEDEARFWFHQILNAVETLQNAGICHRDMSLENIMTTGDGLAIVIDFGMCLKIPYETDEHGIRHRCYMKRDRVCGKPYYISPEICENRGPFDGHAVDMWALGPILFMMVCGFPPFEIADRTDSKFLHFSGGQCEQLLTHWNLGLSRNLMDLLQRMFWVRVSDRLSLAQVRAHPWMNGPMAQPTPERLVRRD